MLDFTNLLFFWIIAGLVLFFIIAYFFGGVAVGWFAAIWVTLFIAAFFYWKNK